MIKESTTNTPQNSHTKTKTGRIYSTPKLTKLGDITAITKGTAQSGPPDLENTTFAVTS